MRLQEFTNRDVYVSSVGAVVSNDSPGRMGGAMSTVRFGTAGNAMRTARPEVHIRTDHITMETLRYAFLISYLRFDVTDLLFI